jgi:hypothetical protein
MDSVLAIAYQLRERSYTKVRCGVRFCDIVTVEEGARKSRRETEAQTEVLGRIECGWTFGVSSDNALVCIEDIATARAVRTLGVEHTP